jgi:uncharacterized protein (DUF433 family)
MVPVGDRSFPQSQVGEVPVPDFDRISHLPDVMGGRACVRGTDVTVGKIVGQIGTGHSIDELLADYPSIERADILQALRYAASLTAQ